MLVEKRIKDWYAAYVNENPRAFKGLLGLIDRSGLKPKQITLLGFLMAVVAACFIFKGNFFVGGLLVIFSGCFDILDGALARFQKKLTKSNIFFDGIIDRCTDSTIFFGLIAFCFQQGYFVYLLLAAVALTACFQVSYIKIRLEAQGKNMYIGIFTRPIVIAVLGIGLIVSAFHPAALPLTLWVLAAGTTLTSIRRLIVGLKILKC